MCKIQYQLVAIFLSGCATLTYLGAYQIKVNNCYIDKNSYLIHIKTSGIVNLV